MSETSESILTITDLLLGAVYADGEGSGEEVRTVRDLLRELLDTRELPEALDARIARFEPSGFSLEECAGAFTGAEPERKRRLLELVAAVRDADGELDISEDEYLVSLAKALGMEESEYSDLALDYEIEDLRANLASLRSIPPPVPSES